MTAYCTLMETRGGCDMSQKVTGLIPDGIIWIFH